MGEEMAPLFDWLVATAAEPTTSPSA